MKAYCTNLSTFVCLKFSTVTCFLKREHLENKRELLEIKNMTAKIKISIKLEDKVELRT